MAGFVTRTPFGNPDGSRSDIQDVVDNFVTFEDLSVSSGLEVRPDDLSTRVIVGAKGSGKTVYLRRLRAAAADNESVYADFVQQDLPSTSNIVSFCQRFSVRNLTEKWMQLWYCAIIRSLVTHLLHAKQLVPYLSEEQRAELEHYQPDLIPRSRREVSVYSQVTDIIHRYHTAHAYAKFFDRPEWAEISATINDIISTMPPIYLFIDSVDEEYASAPMYWLQCQKGLFFRAMRFLRDQHFGGRLHVIVCVRDHVLASVLRGEHQNRYRGEPHITTLGWEYASAEFFLKKKIAALSRDFLFVNPEKETATIEHWLGRSFIENRGRRIREPILQYLLRHTRLLPRDVVILGNKLSEVVVTAKRNGDREISEQAIRQCVRKVSRSFGDEQLAICANHIASSGMPADASRMGYDEIYTGDTEYARGFTEYLRSVIQVIGKDRFGPDELELGELQARELFGEESDALSVLWQNRLLGYVERTPDGPREVFFSEINCDSFNLPLNKDKYLLHSCMIDSADIRACGPPVGQMPTDPAASSRSAAPGHIGDYPILGVIGRGGMGTVYLAEDPHLRRRVALKVLPDGGRRHAKALARFRREAQVLATLNHPGIAMVFSLEEDDGVHFITMEYVVGCTLAERLAEGPLEFTLALALGRQIAEALEAAHRKNVIHRDLKPSNIMVTDEDVVKILDFGLAKVAVSYAAGSESTWNVDDPRTASGSVVGTLGYMSPEQLLGKEVDRRSDVWAFGCCLYECLANRKAFRGDTPPEQMVATMEREPEWKSLSRVPEEIRALLERCLEKDADRRLATMSDVIEWIERVATGNKASRLTSVTGPDDG